MSGHRYMLYLLMPANEVSSFVRVQMLVERLVIQRFCVTCFIISSQYL